MAEKPVTHYLRLESPQQAAKMLGQLLDALDVSVKAMFIIDQISDPEDPESLAKAKRVANLSHKAILARRDAIIAEHLIDPTPEEKEAVAKAASAIPPGTVVH